jgi:Zn-dependent protease
MTRHDGAEDDADMRPTFRLGRIAGVEIGVNWSWAIVFGLIAWSLGARVFPAEEPGLGWGAYLAMAVVASLLFFTSLLLHELGHAVQARREGMEIEGITLWLFGGVAQFKGEFASAGSELRIAIAGPVVTVCLGAFFIACSAVGYLPKTVAVTAAWLGFINLFLLAFNLLPALPLDGGRVLRALLWARSGDFESATRASARASYAISYMMVTGGLLLVLSADAVDGIWLALIGWFLLGAASAETRNLTVRAALAGLKVRDLMVDDPITADPDQTLREFMDGLAGAARFTAYPVVSEGRILGILPLARVLERPPGDWDDVRVRQCMLGTGEVPVLEDGEDAVQGLSDLAAGALHRGLVLHEGRFAGYISITDIARFLERSARPARPA